jgi:AraC family transcriptional regulator
LEKPAECPDRDSPVHKVIEALESRRTSSLAELAHIARRHPVHLARCFREKTGLTIGAYRRRLRLRDLCIDLRADSASLSELAVRHGYSDQAHMTRELKAVSGTTPAAWRER